MENTEILKLPYIMPSQAQKHVTHNEAIRQLDALIQLTVVSMDVSSPPNAPGAGARYIVGENATGEWAGLDRQLVAFLDGAWTAFEPLRGWLAFVEDKNAMVVRSETDWQGLPGPNYLENMEGVGIGAQPDTVNKLAIASEASLFSHAGSSHRMKINKASADQSASMVFQSNWTGHAEIGLTGDNDFHFKVSDDGNTFVTAIQLNKSTGQVRFPHGAETKSRIDISGRWYAFADNRWTTFSPSHGAANENFQSGAGSAAEPSFSDTQIGPFVRKGARIDRILASFRRSHVEVSAFNMARRGKRGPTPIFNPMCSWPATMFPWRTMLSQ